MLLEVCVDTIEGAWSAVRGGAGRIELCSALSEGGLTPSAGLMAAAAGLPVPVYAMIRPRAGLFRYSPPEEQVMLRDIEQVKASGLAGIVIGAQGDDGGLDQAMLARLLGRGSGLGCTLHRVMDTVPDLAKALEVAVELGFERILTSGGAHTAEAGLPTICRLVEAARGRISIMPGSGVRPDNVAGILKEATVWEVHASCSVTVIEDDGGLLFSPLGGGRSTSEAVVRDTVTAMQAPPGGTPLV